VDRSGQPAHVGDAQGPPAAANSRTSRKRAERIERVERTAARLFSEKGYDGANFEQIAAELDLRGPSLYHYFSSKEDLYRRCVQKSGEDVFARLHAITRTGRTSVEKLRALFHEQVLIEVRDYPEFVPLFFKTYVPIASLRDEVLDIRRRHAAIFEKVAEQIRKQLKADRQEVRVWLETAFGALAYLPEWYDPDGQLGVDRLAEIMSATLIAPFQGN
jgi:AcrR family transcriptional regulator